jgi:hypothetical protein
MAPTSSGIELSANLGLRPGGRDHNSARAECATKFPAWKICPETAHGEPPVHAAAAFLGFGENMERWIVEETPPIYPQTAKDTGVDTTIKLEAEIRWSY